MANYIALVIAIMAILIPVSIEIWREQFQSHNLSNKSLLNKEWSTNSKNRYLNGPLLNMALFVGIALVIPLIITNTALFYVAILHGIYLLGYVFFISFYKKSINIYDIGALNDTELPDSDITRELVDLSLSANQQSKLDNNVHNPVWSAQLSQEDTLKKLAKWGKVAVCRVGKSVDLQKQRFWVILHTFIEKCELNMLWASAYGGEIKLLFSDEKFYKNSNLMYASEILNSITKRFNEDETYVEAIKNIFLTIPIKDIDTRLCYDIFMPSFRTVFFASGKVSNSYRLSNSIPAEWIVTISGLQNKVKMVRNSANIYIRWIQDIQRFSSKVEEPALMATTEFLFPEVDTVLFSKFALLATNIPYVLETSATNLKNIMEQWTLFGHIGRVTAEWASDTSELDYAQRYKIQTEQDCASTIKIVRELGWYSKDTKTLKSISEKLTKLLSTDVFKDVNTESWLHFAELIPQLADNYT